MTKQQALLMSSPSIDARELEHYRQRERLVHRHHYKHVY